MTSGIFSTLKTVIWINILAILFKIWYSSTCSVLLFEACGVRVHPCSLVFKLAVPCSAQGWKQQMTAPPSCQGVLSTNHLRNGILKSWASKCPDTDVITIVTFCKRQSKVISAHGLLKTTQSPKILMQFSIYTISDTALLLTYHKFFYLLTAKSMALSSIFVGSFQFSIATYFWLI